MELNLNEQIANNNGNDVQVIDIIHQKNMSIILKQIHAKYVDKDNTQFCVNTLCSRAHLCVGEELSRRGSWRALDLQGIVRKSGQTAKNVSS